MTSCRVCYGRGWTISPCPGCGRLATPLAHSVDMSSDDPLQRLRGASNRYEIARTEANRKRVITAVSDCVRAGHSMEQILHELTADQRRTFQMSLQPKEGDM